MDACSLPLTAKRCVNRLITEFVRTPLDNTLCILLYTLCIYGASLPPRMPASLTPLAGRVRL